MTKEEFIVEFVLRRAQADIPNSDAMMSVAYANSAWIEIQKLIEQENEE